MKTSLALAVAFLIAAAPAAALAQSVTLAPKPGVGDSDSVDIVNKVDAHMTATVDGEKEEMPFYNEDILKLQVTVQAVDGAAITGETFMIEEAARRAIVPGDTVPAVAWRGNGGTSIKVVRDVNGKATEVTTDPVGEIPEEMLEEITPLRPRPRDLGVEGLVEIGKKKKFDANHFLGNKGRATGSVTLTEVVTADSGDEVAVFDVVMVARNPAEGGEVKTDLTGSAHFSLKTGLCVFVDLGGTITINAVMDGNAISGGGKLTIKGTWTDG